MPLDAFHNTYAGNPLDRAGERRSDAAWIGSRLADDRSLTLAFWNGQPLADTTSGFGAKLCYLESSLARALAVEDERLLFLGLRRIGDPEGDDIAVFAVDLEDVDDPSKGVLQSTSGAFQALRALAPRLSPQEAAIAAEAKAVFEWRRRHRFCSVCGQPNRVADAGWKRVCPACHAEHFPRTDPVVIMLATQAHGGAPRCLLGRQAIWPPGMFSTLAGFMEPGESIEEACARELQEEAGLEALDVRYHSSQPWPYPSSLMIGLIAEVAAGEGRPDQTELEAVRWFTKAEALQLLRSEIEGLFAPPPFAIAHQLIKAWAAG